MSVAIVHFVVNVAIIEFHVWCLVFFTTVTIVENAIEFGGGIGACKGVGVELGILGIGLGREADFHPGPFAVAFLGGVIFVAFVLIPNPGVHIFPPIGVVKIDGVGVVLS